VNWHDRVIAELAKVEPELAEIGIDDKDWPQHVKNAAAQLAKALVPTVSLQATSAFTARLLGGFVGHKFSYAKSFQEGLQLASVCSGKMPDKLKEALDDCTVGLREYFPLVRRAVRRCFAIMCDASQEDCAEFSAGFGAALKKGSLTPTARLVGGTDATEFYFYVVMLGPALKQRFKSMKQFHEFCVGLWGQRAGDRKTTEKRCSRIGLSFESDAESK